MPRPQNHETRESWLKAAAEHLFDDLFKQPDIPTPERWRVSVSWPGGGSARKRIGEAWSTKASADGTCEMFISPTLGEALEALGVLTHECIHASDNCENGHRGPFARWARAVGLEGKLTATVPGEELTEYLEKLAKKLGPYPHGKVILSLRKKQTTRMLKLQCGSCGFTARTTQKWLDQLEDRVGMTYMCPLCGEYELEAALS